MSTKVIQNFPRFPRCCRCSFSQLHEKLCRGSRLCCCQEFLPRLLMQSSQRWANRHPKCLMTSLCPACGTSRVSPSYQVSDQSMVTHGISGNFSPSQIPCGSVSRNILFEVSSCRFKFLVWSVWLVWPVEAFLLSDSQDSVHHDTFPCCASALTKEAELLVSWRLSHKRSCRVQTCANMHMYEYKNT